MQRIVVCYKISLQYKAIQICLSRQISIILGLFNLDKFKGILIIDCMKFILLLTADSLIDWIEFYAVSAIFQQCNGRMADRKKHVRAFTLYFIFFKSISKNICID